MFESLKEGLLTQRGKKRKEGRKANTTNNSIAASFSGKTRKKEEGTLNDLEKWGKMGKLKAEDEEAG